MFWSRDVRNGTVRVDLAFTDASIDLQGRAPGFATDLAALEEACGVPFARLSQVHGDAVVEVEGPTPSPEHAVPHADAMVTTRRGLGLMIRAADCVPVVLADPEAGVVGVAHAGRPGLVCDVATRTVEAMQRLGATPATTVAWMGPHVCGGCYEVPAGLRAEVCAAVPEAWATTRWGTPAVDIGVGVRTQLVAAGVEVRDVGGCTREEDRLPSYRRDGDRSGRLAGLVWMS